MPYANIFLKDTKLKCNLTLTCLQTRKIDRIPVKILENKNERTTVITVKEPVKNKKDNGNSKLTASKIFT